MRCEEAQNQLNARADGQLPAEDSAALEAHLAECAECRSAADGLQSVDAELRRAFATRRAAATRLAESTISALRTSTVTPMVHTRTIIWWQPLAGLAAGFLLAVMLFRPWQSAFEGPALASTTEPMARLAVASGPVEVLSAKNFESFTCPTGGSIESNSIVRTGPHSRCEISTGDGNSLRLDCNTEVKLLKPGVVEVSRGKFCSSSPPGRKLLEIQSAGGAVVARPTAQLAVDCQPQSVRVIAVDGPVNVQSGQKSLDVLPGKQVHIIQGKLQDDAESCDAKLETAWVNSVLALRSSEHPELFERVNELLANIGAAKLSLMYEDELRRLGDDGVPPLLAYLASTRDKSNIGERVTAAAIVADVAQPRWIPDLIMLLTDANAAVRSNAARGLERLTGRDQGFKAEQWQTQSWMTCEGPHTKWLKWWEENRDRYPAAHREIAPPKSPPF